MNEDDHKMIKKTKIFAKPLLEWIEWDIRVMEEMKRRLLSPPSPPPSTSSSDDDVDVDANFDADDECNEFSSFTDASYASEGLFILDTDVVKDDFTVI